MADDDVPIRKVPVYYCDASGMPWVNWLSADGFPQRMFSWELNEVLAGCDAMTGMVPEKRLRILDADHEAGVITATYE